VAKNYYLILGVPRDAAPAAVRSAFREMAKRYHPDRGTESDARTFRDVQEAYEVLSDPARRARYDRESRGGPWSRAEPFGPRVAEPEPLVAEPLAVTGEPEEVRPSFEALFDRLLRNFSGAGVPKAERPEPLDFQLILSPEEAEAGVVVPFEVPVLRVCSRCGGAGRDWFSVCGDCEGEGRLVEREILRVTVPAGVRSGTVIEASMRELGVENLWLRLQVRVARH
jgi:DnaJ-class molecular chaperone